MPMSPRLYSRGSPQSVKRVRSEGSARRLGKIVEQTFQLGLAHALDEILEHLVIFTARGVAFREPVDHFGNILRRNGHDRHAVGADVVGPLAAENHLEVRHGVSADLCG